MTKEDVLLYSSSVHWKDCDERRFQTAVQQSNILRRVVFICLASSAPQIDGTLKIYSGRKEGGGCNLPFILSCCTEHAAAALFLPGCFDLLLLLCINVIHPQHLACI